MSPFASKHASVSSSCAMLVCPMSTEEVTPLRARHDDSPVR